MQAEVQSHEALNHLERALASFSSKSTQAVTAMSTQFQRQWFELSSREVAAQHEVYHWEIALEVAEYDEERERARFSLGVAQERLERVRNWQASVRDEYEVFRSQLKRFERLLDQVIPRGRNFLRSRSEELVTYGAVQPGLAASGAAGVSSSGSVFTATSETASAVPMRLTDHLLPTGFRWVPLAEVSEADLDGVSSKDSYRKVEYDKMATGLRRLVEEILPRIQSNADRVGSDTFRGLDEVSGEGFENGLQQVYDAFFGKDYVYMERRRGEETFRVTNGRHRIRVAIDLGWDAVPARVKDLRP